MLYKRFVGTRFIASAQQINHISLNHRKLAISTIRALDAINRVPTICIG